VQLVLSDWLMKNQNVVDAILVATRESRRRPGFDFHLINDKARLLRDYLKKPDWEEQTLAFALDVPMNIPGFPNLRRQ